MTPPGPEVSVVIPSRGGPHLERAVASALAQTDVSIEVLVVSNGADRDISFADHRVTVLSSAPSDGANGARQKGIDVAAGEFIALLDDDDTWDPVKLRTQLTTMQDLQNGPARQWIVGSRLREIRTDGSSTDVPYTGIGEVGPIEEYLFARPRLRSDRPQLQTSTMMFRAELGRDVRFDPARKFHQDWTWLLDAQAAGACAYVVPQVLTNRNVADGGSISGSITWRGSLSWAEEYLSGRTAADFGLTMATFKAARSGQVRGVLTCACWAIRHGAPRLPAVTYWMSQLGRTVIALVLRRANRQGTA